MEENMPDMDINGMIAAAIGNGGSGSGSGKETSGSKPGEGAGNGKDAVVIWHWGGGGEKGPQCPGSRGGGGFAAPFFILALQRVMPCQACRPLIVSGMRRPWLAAPLFEDGV